MINHFIMLKKIIVIKINKNINLKITTITMVIHFRNANNIIKVNMMNIEDEERIDFKRIKFF
jgi:hypothetical protein